MSKYHLNIIDGNIELPDTINIEYTDLDKAYAVLTEFIHSFDGVLQVDGRICDEDGEDIEYRSSVMKN